MSFGNIAMSFINAYTPPPAETFSTYYGPDPYDLNFMLPIQDYLHQLESDRVKLVPLIPRLHAKLLFDQIQKNPEVLRWLPQEPKTLGDFLTFIETNFRRNTAVTAFVVLDKGRPDPATPEFEGSIAGCMTLMNTNSDQLYSEIGWIVILPTFQRTYVTTHSVSLLLRLCLELPADGGFGLRRVQWCTHVKNVKSQAAAARFKFTLEGTMRRGRLLLEGMEGSGPSPRKGDPKERCMSRDTVILSMTCEDWDDFGREYIQKLMDR
jgi:RimJ/RimL family protein N-acetyltransferase